MEGVLFCIIIFFYVVTNASSVPLYNQLQCPALYITDNFYVSSLSEESEDSFDNNSVRNEEVTPVHPVSMRFDSNYPKVWENTTTILDNRYICLIGEKEVFLRDVAQKCLITRTKKDITEPFMFFSPMNPPLIHRSLKPLNVEVEDNFFEALKPIFPLKGSTSSITERINLASSKAGAISIAKSKGMTGNNEVLSSNKYKYCITTCKSNKWFVFSLPEMSLIDAIATANYERFSSSVKKFVLYGSPVYPTISWSFIGYFEAKDGSSLQVFPISIPVWTKFIKFEWLSWYRQEAMCTMSEIRVYGSNMIHTMLQTDFSKSDSRSAGLKDIIDEESKEEVPVEEPEVVISSSERASSPISPEFQPLYELYKRCEEEQGEMTFSIALLSNKTKQKIHALKERLLLIENQTAVLSSMFTSQDYIIHILEQSYSSLQLSLQEVTNQRQSSLWLYYCIAGLALFFYFIHLFVYFQVKKDTINRKQYQQLLQIVKALDTELKGFKNSNEKTSTDEQSRKTKKKSKKAVK